MRRLLQLYRTLKRAPYIHCIFFRSENGGGNLYLQRPDDGGKRRFPILCA